MQRLDRTFVAVLKNGALCALLFAGLVSASTAQQQDGQSSQTIAAAGSDEGATEGAPGSDAAA
jgi:hypothetical protein